MSSTKSDDRDSYPSSTPASLFVVTLRELEIKQLEHIHEQLPT